MKNIAGTVIVASSILALCGCRSAVNSTERATPNASPSIVEDKRIETDSSLAGKLAIVQVNEGVVSGDMLQIQVVLQNRKSKSMTANYAFEWVDQNGMVLNTSQNWKPLQFAGGERKAVIGVAPTPNAVDFSLKIQEPRPFFKRNNINPFKP
ncbi:DUF1425 domain-containing protein [Verrucomicrobia bacterium S94]|nr:DUF1425 domain-containing protein [Verrucomicrobia bacterium S94]